MDRKIIGLLFFSVTFLVSLTLSEQVWEGEDVKKLFKDMKEKEKDFFDDISFDDINEYMRDKLNLILTYLRKNPESISKNEDKVRKVKKNTAQNGIAESRTDDRSTDGNESEEDDDDVKERKKENIQVSSNFDGDCRFSKNGEVSCDYSSQDDISCEECSQVGVSGEIITAQLDQDKGQGTNNVMLSDDQTVLDSDVETLEITKSSRNNIGVDVERKEDYTALDVNEEIVDKGNVSSNGSITAEKTAEDDVNLTPFLDNDKSLESSSNVDSEIDPETVLGTKSESHIYYPADLNNSDSGINKEDFKSSETPEVVDVNDSEETLEENSRESLTNGIPVQSSGWNTFSDGLGDMTNSTIDVTDNITEANIDTESEKDVGFVGKKRYKIDKQEYEYKRKTYRVFKGPGEAYGHGHIAGSAHGKTEDTLSTEGDVSETPTDEPIETTDDSDNTLYGEEYILSNSESNLQSNVDDSTLDSSASEDDTVVQQNGHVSLEDTIREIEEKIISSVAKVPEKILDTFVDYKNLYHLPVSPADSENLNSVKKLKYKDIIDTIQDDVIQGKKLLDTISIKTFLIKYISDKLDKHFTDKLKPYLKSKDDEVTVNARDKGTSEIVANLKQDVFSTLMDAFLLFYDQQSNPDTVLPAEDVISENRFKSNGNTIQYSNVQVKTSESDGAPEIKLSKKIYGYKKLRDNDRSGLSDSDKNRLASQSEEQQEYIADKEYDPNSEEEILHHSAASKDEYLDDTEEQQQIDEDTSSEDVSKASVQSLEEKNVVSGRDEL